MKPKQFRDNAAGYADRRDYDNFQNDFRAFSQANPDHPDKIVVPVKFYLACGDKEAAFAHVEANIDQVKYSAKLASYVVEFCCDCGHADRLDRIIDKWSAAASFDPSLMELIAACMLGRVGLLGEIDARAAAAYPQNPYRRVWAAAAAARLDRKKQAISRLQEYFRAGKLVSNTTTALKLSIRNLQRREILSVLEAYPDLVSGDRSLMEFMARQYRRVGDYDSSIRTIDSLIGKTKDTSRYHLVKSEIYLEMERSDLAIREYVSALRIDLPANKVGNLNKLAHKMVEFNSGYRRSLFPTGSKLVDPHRQKTAEVRKAFMSGDHESVVESSDSNKTNETVEVNSIILAVASCVENNDKTSACKLLFPWLYNVELRKEHYARLRLIVSGFADDDLRKKIARHLVTKDIYGDDEEGAFIHLEAAGSDDEATMALNRCLRLLDSGKPSLQLRMFLESAWDTLVPASCPASLKTRLQEHLRRSHDLMTEMSVIGSVETEREFCGDILSSLELADAPLVTILAPIHRRRDLGNLARNIKWQTYGNIQIVVVANGELFESAEVPATFDDCANVKILNLKDRKIGAYLNEAVDASDGEYLVRFDADDIYLPSYVENAIKVMSESKADIAGQNAYFIYFQKSQSIFYANHGPYLRDVGLCRGYGSGATLIMTRDVAREVRFLENLHRGEDYLFFENAMGRGARVFNLDPFNMIVVRHDDKEGHTWKADDHIIFKGKLEYVGDEGLVSLLAIPGASFGGTSILPSAASHRAQAACPSVPEMVRLSG